MASLSNAEFALLGLLSEGEMHPYHIEQEVQFRDMRFWTELSMSSIYKLLKKMEGEGLVVSQNKLSPENRLQKLYSLSPQGRERLEEAILDQLAQPEHMRWRVDLAVYNSGLIAPERIRAALRTYRAELEKTIAGYHELEVFLAESGCPPHRFELARRPVFLLEAEMAWVDAWANRLEAEQKGGIR